MTPEMIAPQVLAAEAPAVVLILVRTLSLRGVVVALSSPAWLVLARA